MKQIDEFFQARSNLEEKTRAMCNAFGEGYVNPDWVADYRHCKWTTRVRDGQLRYEVEKHSRGWVCARALGISIEKNLRMVYVASDFNDKVWILNEDNKVDNNADA
jgi:hypothetical protein